MCLDSHPTSDSDNYLADSLLSTFLQAGKLLDGMSSKELLREFKKLKATNPELILPEARLLFQRSQQLKQKIDTPNLAVESTCLLGMLSAREYEILVLLAQGLTISQIAENIFISSATVNNHCAKMREKLGLKGRNTLIVFAVQNKMNF